jgi:hypothetical protein
MRLGKGKSWPGGLLAREFVDEAIMIGSTMARAAFLEFAGTNPADRYFVEDQLLRLDAKAVVIVAYNLQFPQRKISNADFRGDKESVALPLAKLGLKVFNSKSNSYLGSAAS